MRSTSTRSASRARAAGLEAVCRLRSGVPAGAARRCARRRRCCHVAGGLERLLGLAGEEPVAIVGSRRASPYGLDVARSLGRGLAASGITVVSGMALGIDSAAHAGALEARRRRRSPCSRPRRTGVPGRAGARCTAGSWPSGAVVSELGPGSAVWRWMFPARNRIIAALAAMTVVVEAGERSGALVTARLARGTRPPGGSRARSRHDAAGRRAQRTARRRRGRRSRAPGRARSPVRRRRAHRSRAAPAAARRARSRCWPRSPRATRRPRPSPGRGSSPTGIGSPGGAGTRRVRAPRRRRPVPGRALTRLRLHMTVIEKLSRIRSGLRS